MVDVSPERFDALVDEAIDRIPTQFLDQIEQSASKTRGHCEAAP